MYTIGIILKEEDVLEDYLTAQKDIDIRIFVQLAFFILLVLIVAVYALCLAHNMAKNIVNPLDDITRLIE